MVFLVSPVFQGWGPERLPPMTEDVPAGRAPDISRCFGRYRAQTPQYALVYCVHCPKLKSCVRTAWGMEAPHRTARREVWWERSPRGLAPRRPAAPRASDYAAT